MKKTKFEERILEIDREIFKRKHKWSLTSLAWMDFNDVAQILRIHINNKWNQYDQAQALAPWVNRIITNQIRNLIRNHYGNFSRPCLKCSAFEGDNLCSVYGKQSGACSLYAKWLKSKKNAYDTKLPVSIENHLQEVHNKPSENLSLDHSIKEVHHKLKDKLKPNEWIYYSKVYIENLSETEAAKALGYKTTEKNRDAGYKQLKNLKKSIIAKVKKIIYNGEIDI
jgi:Fe-S-cluster containining protein